MPLWKAGKFEDGNVRVDNIGKKIAEEEGFNVAETKIPIWHRIASTLFAMALQSMQTARQILKAKELLLQRP